MSEGPQNTYLCVVCLMVGLCSPKALIKVQILRFLPHGRVAQLVERQIEALGADGSSPSLPTNYTGVAQFGLERPVWARKVGSSNLSIRTTNLISQGNPLRRRGAL